MKLKKYYPWFICAAGVLLHFCASGMTSIGFSAYLPYLKENLNLSSTETAMFTTIRCLATVISMFFSDVYYKKISLRKGIFAACLLIPVSYIMFAHAGSVYLCYVASAILGISYGLGTMIPLAQVVKNWFISLRGTVLAVTASGAGIATVVLPPVIVMLTETFNIVVAFYAVAIMGLVSALLLLLIIRDKPEDLQMEPYYKEDDKAQASEKAVRKNIHKDMTKIESAAFMIAVLLVGCSATPYVQNFTLHYTNIGYAPLQAAAAVSVYGVVITFGKVLFGAGSDRFGTYRMNYVAFGAWIIAGFMTAFLNGSSISFLYASACLSGIGVPLSTVGITLWSGELSSEEKYTKMVKSGQTIYQAGSLIGTVIPGILADITGGYGISYIVFSVMLAFSMMFMQTLYKKHGLVTK